MSLFLSYLIFAGRQWSCRKVMFSSCVCMSTEGIPCGHYPWFIRPHHGGALPLGMGPHHTSPSRVLAQPLLKHIWLASGWYASYWNAFLTSEMFTSKFFKCRNMVHMPKNLSTRMKYTLSSLCIGTLIKMPNLSYTLTKINLWDGEDV